MKLWFSPAILRSLDLNEVEKRYLHYALSEIKSESIQGAWLRIHGRSSEILNMTNISFVCPSLLLKHSLLQSDLSKRRIMKGLKGLQLSFL